MIRTGWTSVVYLRGDTAWLSRAEQLRPPSLAAMGADAQAGATDGCPMWATPEATPARNIPN